MKNIKKFRFLLKNYYKLLLAKLFIEKQVMKSREPCNFLIACFFFFFFFFLFFFFFCIRVERCIHTNTNDIYMAIFGQLDYTCEYYYSLLLNKPITRQIETIKTLGTDIATMAFLYYYIVKLVFYSFYVLHL